MKTASTNANEAEHTARELADTMPLYKQNFRVKGRAEVRASCCKRGEFKSEKVGVKSQDGMFAPYIEHYALTGLWRKFVIQIQSIKPT